MSPCETAIQTNVDRLECYCIHLLCQVHSFAISTFITTFIYYVECYYIHLLYHIVSHHLMSYHITSYHITSYQLLKLLHSFAISSYYIHLPYHIVSHHVTSHHIRLECYYIHLLYQGTPTSTFKRALLSIVLKALLVGRFVSKEHF